MANVLCELIVCKKAADSKVSSFKFWAPEGALDFREGTPPGTKVKMLMHFAINFSYSGDELPTRTCKYDGYYTDGSEVQAKTFARSKMKEAEALNQSAGHLAKSRRGEAGRHTRPQRDRFPSGSYASTR